MTAAHFIYIPMAMLVGVVIGFIMGGRAARDAQAMDAKKAERRAAARAEREKRKNAPPPPAAP